jgi:Xaa-Pro aminopeptidase
MFDKRINHLRFICEQNNVDAFLVSTTYNIFYLTGFADYIADEREGFLFVTKKGVYMLTSPLYSDAVKRIAPHVMLLLTSNEAWYTDLLKKIIDEEGIKSIGFEDQDLRYVEYEEFYNLAELVPFTLRGFRKQKSKDEIDAIEKACNMADELFDYTQTIINPGISEKEVALEMELFVRRQHAHLAFPSIVAFGTNSAAIHHVPTDKKLADGDFILLDFGVKIDEYCSDISRTLFCGTPSAEQKKMYEAVKNAQQAAIDFTQAKWKEGQKAIVTHDMDNAARMVFEENHFPSFPHALGHGIGLEVHEAPTVSRNAKDTIDEGTIYTIEPGIYFSGKEGIRIEDMFVMDENGPRQLTHSTKELLVIKS